MWLVNKNSNHNGAVNPQPKQTLPHQEVLTVEQLCDVYHSAGLRVEHIEKQRYRFRCCVCNLSLLHGRIKDWNHSNDRKTIKTNIRLHFNSKSWEGREHKQLRQHVQLRADKPRAMIALTNLFLTLMDQIEPTIHGQIE